MDWTITERPEWGAWATPKSGRLAPVHRWFLFPHSFSSDLVRALIGEWGLTERDVVLDPFVGSGTTLVAAKESGVAAAGFDLSPLAVLASTVKTRGLEREHMEAAWGEMEKRLPSGHQSLARSYSDLVRRALPKGRLQALDAIASEIEGSGCSSEEREFFQLALLAIIPQFSHAVASGGWLRWSNEGASAEQVPGAFKEQVELMLSDLDDAGAKRNQWVSSLADARSLPSDDEVYSGVITSPPYPNRHDYTRVFGVELLFAFYDWEANRRLRYQTFESHPEAKPERQDSSQYEPPKDLEAVTQELSDPRIRRMLEGYFLDMYLCLSEVLRVCRAGAKAAFVVGNAQYEGHAVLVDQWTAEVGEQAGLRCEEIRAIRWRGNSAQQMGRFGRRAARESIVIFSKPSNHQDDHRHTDSRHRHTQNADHSPCPKQ